MQWQRTHGVATRREFIKGAVRATRYAAPLVVTHAMTTHVAAVTGSGGVTLLINGGTTAILTRGSVYSLTGQGYQPGAALAVIFCSNTPTSTRPSDAFGTGTLTVASDGTISLSAPVLSIVPVRINGPGSFSVIIATGDTVLPDGSVQAIGVLMSLTFTVTD